MDIQTKFVSQDNKRILWEIMVENNLFTNIPNKYVNKIKADFEDSLEKISKTIVSTDNILNLNKKSIMLMIEEVQKYSQIADIPITSAEALVKKQEKFQKGLQTKQEEFTSLIQPVKPQSIDFTEKITDEPIGSEMDIKLSQTIAWREKQLSQVLEKQSPVEASEWINNGKKVSTASVSNHITIGNSTKIDESNIINLKKVSFVDATDTRLDVNELRLQVSELQNNTVIEPKKMEPPPFNFMDKLKKKDGLEEVKNDLVLVKADIELLKTNVDRLILDNKLILENQEKILDKIEQIAFQVGSI